MLCLLLTTVAVLQCNMFILNPFLMAGNSFYSCCIAVVFYELITSLFVLDKSLFAFNSSNFALFTFFTVKKFLIFWLRKLK
mmetsp:Transcript_33669/g.44434  ORF Transcript_33669/g.44434 Transcript_33669/m.44434 type:complete len:81 (+) Transcript_33669:4143-4385(+)